MTTPAETPPRGAIASILAVSVAACAFLFWLLYFREAGEAAGDRLRFLPAVNAGLNAASAVCLVLGFAAIRRGAVARHRTLMSGAFALSTLFLLGYITHHALHGDTRFVGEGWVRGSYLVVLASHVVLSVVALPLVLLTFFLSLTGRFTAHRRLARFTLPVWLYVSVTGVLVFVMLNTLSA